MPSSIIYTCDRCGARVSSTRAQALCLNATNLNRSRIYCSRTVAHLCGPCAGVILDHAREAVSLVPTKGD